ncbi:alpha/beta-hydrolase [Ceratobasidium sp. AG-I]|nr:alpha/beta-hydrolase [Ceratobasidium sp. AG-I]
MAHTDPKFEPKPFKVNIPHEEIERMKTLLQIHRLPTNPAFPGVTSDAGTEHWWMHEAKQRLMDFDWRQVESKLNSFAQFTVVIEGATIHYIYEKSKAKNSIPLLLLHGWPSSILEFSKVIEPLVNPPEGTQAFDVVIPSLPGVGYSTLLPKSDATVVDNARIFDTLMTQVLGYKTYVGQGGDFGAVNLRQLQINHSTTLKLGLFQSFFAPRPPDAVDDSTLPIQEQVLLDHIATFTTTGMGYFLVQASRVSTIGLTMYDNPQAYLAWLGYKYLRVQKWAKLSDEVNQTFMDEMYAVILFQQYTATIHTAMAMYQHSGVEYGINSWKNNPPNQAPFGVQHFEGEFYLAPQSWIKNHGPLIWHKYHERGGHFAAIGCPQEFVDDCRTFFGEHYWKQAGVDVAI